MKRHAFYRSLVVRLNDNGIRPAGPPDACMYCKQKVGGEHLLTCVCVYKRVEMKLVFESVDQSVTFEVDEPFNWDRHSIEFRYNESSWCADNLDDGYGDEAAALAAHARRVLKIPTKLCLCGKQQITFVREADSGPFVYVNDVYRCSRCEKTTDEDATHYRAHKKHMPCVDGKDSHDFQKVDGPEGDT